MYIYEVKISLFTNVASKRKGAQLLLESGLLDVLGHCNFINQRPKSTSNTGKHRVQKSNRGTDTFFFIGIDSDKTLMGRYDQVLLPTLRLIVTLLYSIGRENDSLQEMVLTGYSLLCRLIPNFTLPFVGGRLGGETTRSVDLYPATRQQSYHNDLFEGIEVCGHHYVLSQLPAWLL